MRWYFYKNMNGVVRGLGISCSFSLPIKELMSMKMKLAGVGFGIAKRGILSCTYIKLCNSTGCCGY